MFDCKVDHVLRADTVGFIDLSPMGTMFFGSSGPPNARTMWPSFSVFADGGVKRFVELVNEPCRG